MIKNLLTPWFNGNIHKPIRKGVYMLMGTDGAGYQYWNGQCWHLWSDTVEGAFADRNYKAGDSYQNDDWRGLSLDWA